MPFVINTWLFCMTTLKSKPPVIALLATLPARRVLLQRALSTVVTQTALPDAVVIVSDGELPINGPLDPDGSSLPLHCLANSFAKGAANTWNTGIAYIAAYWPDCYVAILDDDDEWDADHLATCLITALQHSWPDVVLSGLRMIRDGVELPREPIKHASIDDFLAGNPGWQGSNTFICLGALMRAGGFTPGLHSCNDRDLAIRVLSLSQVSVAYTGRHSVSWHLDSGREALSSPSSQSKLAGLAHFYHLHGQHMEAEVRQQFFARSHQLFGWTQEQILQRAREWKHA